MDKKITVSTPQQILADSIAKETALIAKLKEALKAHEAYLAGLRSIGSTKEDR